MPVVPAQLLRPWISLTLQKDHLEHLQDSAFQSLTKLFHPIKRNPTYIIFNSTVQVLPISQPPTSHSASFIMPAAEQAQLSSSRRNQNLHSTIVAKPFSAVLGFGPITKDFCCVGIKNGPIHKPLRCKNRINKENREKAVEILEEIDLLNSQTDDFGDLLRELADALLCAKRTTSDHRTDQRKIQVEKWQALIDEAIRRARRDGNTIMGEASDTTGSLLQDQDELQIRLDRLRVSEGEA